MDIYVGGVPCQNIVDKNIAVKTSTDNYIATSKHRRQKHRLTIASPRQNIADKNID